MTKPSGTKKRKLHGTAAENAARGKRKRAVTKAVRTGAKPPRKAAADEIAIAQQRLEAIEMRSSGYTFQQIGQRLVPPRSTAYAFKLFNDAMDELRAETLERAEQVRSTELLRLDAMMIEPFKAAQKGNLQSIATVLKIMERRAALVGADVPQRQEHSGPNGGPIPITRVEIVIVDVADPDSPGVSALPAA